MSSAPPPHLVLVVEDHESTREAFALLLSSVGYRVATAPDGRQALEHLRHGERPCLILLDLMMPGMDGWQFREEQRRDEQLADIPVIVCSAAGNLRERAGRLQAASYLDKPIDPDLLLTTVYRVCHAEG
jgi:CheY-like chemotaxis protein